MTIETLPRSSGDGVARPTRVLFVCVGNSARSIMAEAILRSIGGERFEVHSAGTAPRGVNPLALRTLEQAHLPTDGLRSTSLDDYLGQQFDYVITLCDEAQEACPVFPGVQDALHWGYDDPAAVSGTDEDRLAAFQRVFRQLGERIRTFVLLVERQRRESSPGEMDTTAEEVARIGVLRQVPLFAGLTDRGVSTVARVATEQRFAEGEVIVQQGDPGETFVILVSGRADVTKDGKSIRSLGRADFLGEIALLDGGTRTATVTATAPVDALVIRRDQFLRLIEESPAVRLGILDELTRRLRRDAAPLV
jgi:arsenate reductase